MSSIIKLSNIAKSKNVRLTEGIEIQNQQPVKPMPVILQKDQNEIELKKMYEKGFREGQESIRIKTERDYVEKLLQKTQQFSLILSTINEKLLPYEDIFDKAVIELAIMIAEKIIVREIAKETIITDILRKAIKKIIGANDIIIKLNPSDFEKIITDSQTMLLEQSIAKIKFEQNDSIEIGGCLVETDIGNVDARISTQIDEIKKQFESMFTVEE